MFKRAVVVLLILLAGAAVGELVATVVRKRSISIDTVDDIESQIAALDPATRASVVARLAKDSVDVVRSHA